MVKKRGACSSGRACSHCYPKVGSTQRFSFSSSSWSAHVLNLNYAMSCKTTKIAAAGKATKHSHKVQEIILLLSKGFCLFVCLEWGGYLLILESSCLIWSTAGHVSLLWSLQHTSHFCLTNFKLSSFKYRIIATFRGTFSFFCYDSCCLKSKTGIKANNICSICIRKSIY